MAKTKAELQAENEALRADLDLIGNRLLAEARDRSWCGVYDEVMTEINGLTSEPHMLPCATEVKVVAEGTVTLAFSDLSVELSTDSAEPSDEEIVEAVERYLNDEVGLHARMHYVMDGIRGVEINDSRVL